jgi:MoaA/NifB/PqqE/SkfB family radical SAM enzyme
MRHLRRDLRLGLRLARATVAPVTLPFKLTFCLTFRCNHRCGICAIWSRDKGEEMTAEQIDRLFASIPALSWLDLTGGEIVLRRDLEQIARSLHTRLPRLGLLHFPTNGLLPEAIERAAGWLAGDSGVRTIVSVSIDGPPELHDRLRGVAGAFDAAIETLARLDRVPGVTAYPGMTLQPDNLDAIDSTAEAIARHRPGFGLRDLHVNFLHRSPHYFQNSGIAPCDTQRLAAVLADFVRRKGRSVDPVRTIERLYLQLSDAHLRTGRSPIACRSAEVSAYVAPDGTVYPCTIDDRPMGRLAEHDFDLARLWATAERRRLREEIAADRCPGCWTPCEAYQTLLTSPLSLLAGRLRKVVSRRQEERHSLRSAVNNSGAGGREAKPSVHTGHP